jgi:zinc/manganese transport system permease protein
VLSPLFEPGFFSSEPVHVALVVGTVVSVVSAVVGIFTVMRGQSFAGHSLADIGSAGGSGAYLVGVNALYGFVGFNLVAAAVMGLIGIHRARGRDVATGIVLGASLGLAALFLYWDTTSSSTTGATISVLFGSLFVLSSFAVPYVCVLAAVALAMVVLLYRPLLLSSVSTEIAAARGIPVRLVSVGYLLAMAVAVSLSAVTIGAILSTALLIGPAATAFRLTRRTGYAMALAAVIGIFATWVGILLAYDSYYWLPRHESWPVSFFIVTVVFVCYLVAPLVAKFCTGKARSRRVAATGQGAATSPLAATNSSEGSL